MTRYIAWWEGDPGFDTPEDVEEWIARQDDPHKYVVVATTGKLPESVLQTIEWNTKHQIDLAVAKAIAGERRRVREVLGV